MKTYQDYLKVEDNDDARMKFCRAVITEHKNSDMYKNAVIADEYDRQQNTTIMNFKRALFNLQGKPVDDLWSANYKLASNYFKRFVTQENQFLLGNGVSWKKEDTKNKLGDDFDTRLQQAGRAALVGGVSFGFWNLDKMIVFKITEFAPLYDEDTGALRAGVRFWQIESSKPLRATFYEEDGYTDYIWKKGKGEILTNAQGVEVGKKRAYILKTRTSEVDGTEIYDGENYPTFPIVPLWGNPHHQSEILGIRSKIDAYDIVESGFADDLDSAQIYWILHNTGGMEDADLAQFIERLHIVHAATVDDSAGVGVDAHTVDIPHESREKLLDRLKSDLYKEFMALDTDNLANGNATATQIRAAYEPLNSKADEYEYCIHDFLDGILAVAGIEDTPTFTRSMIVNVQEEVQVLVQAASYLETDYVTRKIMTLFGDTDLVDDMLAQRDAEDMERLDNVNTPKDEQNPAERRTDANET